MQKYIGRQLKTARLNKKLTQEQIAEAVGLSAKHYGCIERGEVSTTVAVLTRLQQVLQTRRGQHHCSRTDTFAAGAANAARSAPL